jgi:hypothetical protein
MSSWYDSIKPLLDEVHKCSVVGGGDSSSSSSSGSNSRSVDYSLMSWRL